MDSRKKIAYVPGAFRPFGDHHMRMVRHYADTCDDVVVVVSSPADDDSQRKTCLGSAITPISAKEIVDLCIADSGLENVRCEVSRDPNPIRQVLRDISRLNDCDVVLGVSTKDDIDRYSSIDPDFFNNAGVRIVPPEETAFQAVDDQEGTVISASDIREHLDDDEMLKTYLPSFIEDDTFRRICDILRGRPRDSIDKTDELRLGSSIFESLLADMHQVEDGETASEPDSNAIDEEETEYSSVRMDDSALESANCFINAYNAHVMERDDDQQRAYNPKNNPDKAVDILFELPDGNEVEIYLDTDTKEWDSRINGSAKLTPDQMGCYLGTDFQRRVDGRLKEIWPGSDPFFSGLLDAVETKRINYEPCGMVSEDGEFRKGNIDKSRSRGKNAAGEQIYTNSGRKIVTFSDFGVKHTDDEAYYCWPERGKEWKWSQWADYTKIHPLLRMRFKHLSYVYGLSMSPLVEDDENRGFRSYNLDLEPKLQYCTPIETAQMMDLTIVQKFLRNSYKRLKRFTDVSDNEIFERIGRPDKCTIGDIRKTKHVIKTSMKAIRAGRADTYIYT